MYLLSGLMDLTVVGEDAVHLRDYSQPQATFTFFSAFDIEDGGGMTYDNAMRRSLYWDYVHACLVMGWTGFPSVAKDIDLAAEFGL